MKLTSLVFFSIFVFIVNETGAQGLSCDWVSNTGNENYDIAEALTVDRSGNVFTAGYCVSQDSALPSDVSAQKKQVLSFIVKHDVKGIKLWELLFDRYKFVIAAMATDAQGNLLLTGRINANIIRKAGGEIIGTPSGILQLVKIDPNGKVLWGMGLKEMGNGQAVTVGPMGNIHVCGSENISLMVEENDRQMRVKNPNLVIFKLNSFGKIVWKQHPKELEQINVRAMRISASGRVYLTGSFTSGRLTVNCANNKPCPDYDIFIACYDPEGKPVYLRRFGGSEWDNGFDLALDKENAYVTGFFRSTAVKFDDITIREKGTLDFFVFKLNASGQAVWAKSMGGKKMDFGMGIAITGDGIVWVAGTSTSRPFTAGQMVCDNENSSGNLAQDIVLVSLSKAGKVLSCKGYTGSGHSQISKLEAAPGNGVYLGVFRSKIHHR